MAGASDPQASRLGTTQRTEDGWVAAIPLPGGAKGPQGGMLTIGTFVSKTMAARSLDLLRLASGLHAGLPPSAVPLEYPVEDYMDDQTATELKTFTLPEIVAAVRSFAIGGARAPACGIVDPEVEAAAADDGEGGDGEGVRISADDAEAANWRGITRDNNGRQQYWIALLYAALDKEKRPVTPAQANKTSLYIACCKSAREAAVAHDLAVVWWRVGCAYAYLWEQDRDQAQQQQQPQGQEGQQQEEEEGSGQEQERQQQQQQGEGSGQEGEERPQNVAQPPAAVQQQQQQAGGGGGGGARRQGVLPEIVDWQADMSALKQLNFPPEMYTANQPLMRQLLGARTLGDLRSLVSQMRNSGGLEQLAAGSHTLHSSPALEEGMLASWGGGSAATAAAAAALRRRARKPGSVGAVAPARPASAAQRRAAVAAGAAAAPGLRAFAAGGGAGGAFELGKHGRLHDKPYMGLVRDRQITLHPWRPMICAVVEGHSKPQPRSLASCATAEEAAVARDLGWIWLWKRNMSLRQHASLNFSLQSYVEHGGSLLDDIAQQQTLEGVRAYLRTMRDSGRLLELATTLERSLGRLDQPRVEPVVHGPGGKIGRRGGVVGAGGGRRGDGGSGGRLEGSRGGWGGRGGGGGSREDGEEEEGGEGEAEGGEELDEDVLAAEEMMHLLEGGGGGDGGRKPAAAAKQKKNKGWQAEQQRRARQGSGGPEGWEEEEEEGGRGEEEGEERWGGAASGTPASSSWESSESEEDAGAIEDSEDDDWQARKKRPPRKRQRTHRQHAQPLPPPAGRDGGGGAAQPLPRGHPNRPVVVPRPQPVLGFAAPAQPPAGPGQRAQQAPRPAAYLESATMRMLLNRGGSPGGKPGWAASPQQGQQRQGQGQGQGQASPAPPLARHPSLVSPPLHAQLAAGRGSPGFGNGGGGGGGASTPAAALLPSEGWDSPGGMGGDGGSAGRFVGVQRISNSKQASKQWIPRPTVRVQDGKRTLSKQLTLCYCDSAEEAAVARDLATVWNWHQLGGQEHGGQQRLNFALSRYHAQPGVMRQLAGVDTTEAMQQLTKELRDSGTLRQLAERLGTPAQQPLPAGGSPLPNWPAGQGGEGGEGEGHLVSIEVPLPPDPMAED